MDRGGAVVGDVAAIRAFCYAELVDRVAGLLGEGGVEVSGCRAGREVDGLGEALDGLAWGLLECFCWHMGSSTHPAVGPVV